ncbi:MAG: hypothetical protein M1823_006445, partial [Watsoniomyces obsoletus]
MPEVEASLEFLARLPLYETEKPYLMLPQKGSGLDPDDTRLDNLEFERHDHVIIKDMRGEDYVSIDSCGFEVYRHSSCFSSFNSVEDINAYKSETESVLRKRFMAAHVVTYDSRLRRNEDFGRREIDLTDKLIVEGPAK